MSLNLGGSGGGNGGVEVDVESALSTTMSVHDIVDDMGEVLKLLLKNAEDAQSMWKGSASKAFNDAADAWHLEGTQLQTALEGLKTSLQSGFTGYDSEDQDVASTIGSVMGSSPIGTHTNLA